VVWTNTAGRSLPNFPFSISPPSRESEWIRIQTMAAKKTLELGQIKMATHNLFALMCKHLHRRISPQEADQTLLQLDKVCMPSREGVRVFAWCSELHGTTVQCNQPRTHAFLPQCLSLTVLMLVLQVTNTEVRRPGYNLVPSLLVIVPALSMQ